MVDNKKKPTKDLTNVEKDYILKESKPIKKKIGRPKNSELSNVKLALQAKRKLDKKIHGTGCALSTSILCNLIKSKDLSKSCKEANNFMEKYLKNSLDTGEQDFIYLNQ